MFFYCKNEKEIKEELNRLILPIKFQSNELNYIFKINSNDILKESGDYIFIKILFQQYGGNWILGKPFLFKYKFMLNPELKEIGFYSSNNKNKKSNQNNSKWKLILIIFILCIIFAILGVILGKKIYGLKRKKRANEMADDDYEYFSENQKQTDKNGLTDETEKKDSNINNNIN